MNKSHIGRLYVSLSFYLLFILWEWIWLISAEDENFIVYDTTVDAYNQSRCGQLPLQHRIAQGSDGRLGQFPSFVSILIKKDGFYSESYTCGGTIIGARHIISAAHCFKKRDISQILITSHMLGVQYAVTFEPETVYEVARVCLSGNFRDGQPDARGYLTNLTINDVAIVYLDRPIAYSDTVQPACLPDKEMRGTGTVAGMGLVDLYQKATVLQFTHAQVTDCLRKAIHGSIMCIKRKSNKQGRACRGDSGGPFYLMDGERHTAVGGISFGSIVCSADDSPVMVADYYKLRHEISRLITACMRPPP